MMFHRFIPSNSVLKILSLITAFGIWNVVIRQTIVEKTIQVPVCLQTSSDHIWNIPTTIQTTLKGTYMQMRTLDEQSVIVHIPEQVCTKNTNWIALNESFMSLPHTVKMVHCHPSMICISKHIHA